VQDQARGIRLGIATDDQNFLTEIGECRERVLGRGGFTDATFSIKGDLTQRCHFEDSFLLEML
jgi:hypothetical protein